ncbi:MAG: DNA repair protein RecO [Mycoplasma sp.]
MLIVTKGYLLKKTPHNDFDEIIEFINQHGIKFVCISLGSRKIASKNKYHLNFGNFLEFEFFHSETKISKLKKVSTISYLEEDKKLNYSLFVINEIYSQLEMNNAEFFRMYQLVILSIIQDINDYIITLFLLVRIYIFSGLSISFDSCWKCGGKKHMRTIDFNKFGVVCKMCWDKDLNKQFKKSTLNIFQQMQTCKQESLINFKIEDIDDMRSLIKSVMFFINDNLGIFFETLKLI